MKKIALVAILLAAPAAAQPTDMPNYDVEQHCRRVGAFGGNFSETLYGSCFDMEQQAYNELKGRWAGLPARMRTHCDRVARFGGGGSFSLLQSCVQMEETAGSQNQRRQFQR